MTAKSVMQQVFGPGPRWYERASRVLGIDVRNVFFIAAETRPLSRRQLAIILAYGANRRQSMHSEKRRALERVAVSHQRAVQSLLAGLQAGTALEAEMRRTGKS